MNQIEDLIIYLLHLLILHILVLTRIFSFLFFIYHRAGEVSIPPDNETGVTVTVRPRNKANPGNDQFAQRIPFLKQISLSYGGDYCQQANDLSLELPPPKIKGKRRDLTLHEKEVFSKEGL